MTILIIILTLSGHTHGLQMGIEIPGWIKWSPSKYAYKQWAGLYEEAGRFVNVNQRFWLSCISWASWYLARNNSYRIEKSLIISRV